MSKLAVTETETETHNKCEHCGRTFIRDSTLLKHMCEQKRRWQDRDKKGNVLGFSAWLRFYTEFQPSRKKKEYLHFITSPYYTAFVKFGNYCHNIRAINISAYVDYLLKNKVPLDNWDSDRVYTKYLIEYLKTENCVDAIKRSIETLLDISQQENIRLEDVFKYVNANKICHHIVTGRISPWILYHSKSGSEFLQTLNTDQTMLIFDYIDPEKWQIKFLRDRDMVNEAKEIIFSIRYL